MIISEQWHHSHIRVTIFVGHQHKVGTGNSIRSCALETIREQTFLDFLVQQLTICSSLRKVWDCNYIMLRKGFCGLGLLWSTVWKEKSRSQATEEMCAKIHAWILNHLHVVNSPIARDMFQVKHPETGKKEEPDKLYLKYQYENCTMICWSFRLMVVLIVQSMRCTTRFRLRASWQLRHWGPLLASH